LSYLIDKYLDPDEAIRVFQKTIRGNFAFVIFIKKNNCFYVLKNGSPIAISNQNETFYI
jgi:glucosamine 6-phosphate synthetase-like amidotransferase/phosphosugar isomerase protein